MYVEFHRVLVYLHVYGIGFIHYFICHCLDPWHVWILISVSFSFLIYSKFPLLAKAHGLKPEMFYLFIIIPFVFDLLCSVSVLDFLFLLSLYLLLMLVELYYPWHCLRSINPLITLLHSLLVCSSWWVIGCWTHSPTFWW